MVLRNYIELQDGVPARMHFTDHDLVAKEILDPLTGRLKSINALMLQVDRLGGAAVSGTFSVVSEKLATMLSPWIAEHRYRSVELIITKRGRGFQTTFSVEVAPRG